MRAVIERQRQKETATHRERWCDNYFIEENSDRIVKVNVCFTDSSCLNKK